MIPRRGLRSPLITQLLQTEDVLHEAFGPAFPLLLEDLVGWESHAGHAIQNSLLKVLSQLLFSHFFSQFGLSRSLFFSFPEKLLVGLLFLLAQASGTFWSIPFHFLSKVGAVQRLLANAADQLARLDIQLYFAGSADRLIAAADTFGELLTQKALPTSGALQKAGFVVGPLGALDASSGCQAPFLLRLVKYLPWPDSSTSIAVEFPLLPQLIKPLLGWSQILLSLQERC
mmetsp:Transcript_84129/g.171495  ORF Transcript_84129/g.171495 Transcript_84129/m.171495 type:complete len:229 (+) Transcript_84129:372-1058(+)